MDEEMEIELDREQYEGNPYDGTDDDHLAASDQESYWDDEEIDLDDDLEIVEDDDFDMFDGPEGH